MQRWCGLRVDLGRYLILFSIQAQAQAQAQGTDWAHFLDLATFFRCTASRVLFFLPLSFFFDPVFFSATARTIAADISDKKAQADRQEAISALQLSFSGGSLREACKDRKLHAAVNPFRASRDSLAILPHLLATLSIRCTVALCPRPCRLSSHELVR